MADLGGFDANEVEPSGDLPPLPAGKYLAVITDSEMKTTKSGTGEYLQLQFQIIEGPYQNRLVWVRLNLNNPNDEAVRIARGQLSSLCRAIGVLTPHDSSELHDLPCLIHVRLKHSKELGELVNEVKGYSKVEPAPTAVAATAKAGSPSPWKR